MKYEIVEAITSSLSELVEAGGWKSGFPVGKMTLESLVDEANEVDFGIFVFGADDKLEASIGIPRDNVLYEGGYLRALWAPTAV